MKRLVVVLVALFAMAQTAKASLQVIPLTGASASYSQPAFGIAYAIDGSLDNAHGWAVHPNEQSDQWARFATNVEVAPGSDLTFTLSQLFAPTSNPYHLIREFQLSVIDAVTHAVTPVNPILVSATSKLSVTGSVVENMDYHTPSLPRIDTYILKATSPYVQIEGFWLDVYHPVGTQPSNDNFVLTEFGVTGDVVPEPAAIIVWSLLGLAAAGYGLWRRRAA